MARKESFIVRTDHQSRPDNKFFKKHCPKSYLGETDEIHTECIRERKERIACR